MKQWWKQFKNDNQGIGVVEIILILVVLIALVIIFKDQLTTLVNSIFDKIGEGSTEIMSTIIIPNLRIY